MPGKIKGQGMIEVNYSDIDKIRYWERLGVYRHISIGWVLDIFALLQ